MGEFKKISIERSEAINEITEEIELAVSLKLISEIISEHLGKKDEKKVAGMMLSITMNLMTNGHLCPKCYKDALNTCVDNAFDITLTDDDDHEVSIKTDGLMGDKKPIKPNMH